MDIYLEETSRGSIIKDYCNFNQLQYTNINFWDDNQKCYTFNQFTNLKDSLLIISFNIFNTLFDLESNRDKIFNFCQHNFLWVWNDIDGVQNILKSANIEIFNKKINANSVTFFLDGEIDSNIKFNNLSNIKCLEFPQNFFLKFPRIKNASVEKNNLAKDFLLTTIIKNSAPHRANLWEELLNKKYLLDHGHIKIHTKRTPDDLEWLGELPTQHTWRDGFPSMDLYRDSFLEIVPETRYQHAHFITEKTIKPIATKTPFLTLSTPGYLKYLRKNGFKTFSGLIDEKYDLEEDMPTRAKLIVDLLDDIIKNNTREFYQASLPILEHNQQRLFEISGSWDYTMDIFIKNALDSLG